MTSSWRGPSRQRPSWQRPARHWSILIIAGWLIACGQTADESPDSLTDPSAAEPKAPQAYIPEPDMTDMEPQVASRLRDTRSDVERNTLSAEAWGRFGMVTHAHELWEEAREAYVRAQSLDPSDHRWPYFLGDVLSVIGTDLEGAAVAFRRSLELHPDYAAAHMRLGRVLVADNQEGVAATEFERALELDPELQPAQVALAQIRLAEGELEDARSLLEGVLEENPRHGQALSTLGQVYMRLGRRDEARAIATRARDAALYNLFSDPVMSQVVNEGISSVLVWERAQAFFEDGNYDQAVKGLEQVVRLAPGNLEARYQLAVAYNNVGRPQESKPHLERLIELDPDKIDARVQLATAYLDEQNPAAAVPHLRHALQLDANDPDAGWLLGRALVVTGQLEEGLSTFERARRVAGLRGASIPGWAHNEWGSALAQTGRLQEAIEHFMSALERDPQDAQALFYLGLVHEGMGRTEEAVRFYCRSTAAQPNPPAAGRLAALGHSCS